MELVVQSKEELANIVEGIARGINDGLKAALSAGVKGVQLPERVKVSGIYLKEANAGTVTTTTATPESTDTSTQVASAAVSATVQANGAQSQNETATPSGRTTRTVNRGSDTGTTERDYTEV